MGVEEFLVQNGSCLVNSLLHLPAFGLMKLVSAQFWQTNLCSDQLIWGLILLELFLLNSKKSPSSRSLHLQPYSRAHRQGIACLCCGHSFLQLRQRGAWPQPAGSWPQPDRSELPRNKLALPRIRQSWCCADIGSTSNGRDGSHRNIHAEGLKQAAHLRMPWSFGKRRSFSFCRATSHLDVFSWQLLHLRLSTLQRFSATKVKCKKWCPICTLKVANLQENQCWEAKKMTSLTCPLSWAWRNCPPEGPTACCARFRSCGCRLLLPTSGLRHLRRWPKMALRDLKTIFWAERDRQWENRLKLTFIEGA